MSGFDDSQELLQDFLTEATELLDDVDVSLMALESAPTDNDLLNRVFRGFHTVKGGAGFLEAHLLVELCHHAENLLDKLRSKQLIVDANMMDSILAATNEVRRMFGQMASGHMPSAAPAALLEALKIAAEGRSPAIVDSAAETPPAMLEPATSAQHEPSNDGIDWPAYYEAAFGVTAAASGSIPNPATAAATSAVPASTKAIVASPKTAAPAGGGGTPQFGKESTIRVDTTRFDQILNLSGEIGLTKNRLTCLRAELRAGVKDTGEEAESRQKTLDGVLAQLDTLVSDLQAAVMRARMQPVGRVFQKYSRLARDLGRQLGKDIELVITGADTEVDKTILEELNDPLVHLVRNAVDHGIESKADRRAAGKPERGTVQLSARQAGDHIVIEITDDGKGMHAEFIRQKAIDKGLISIEEAGTLDERQISQLIFLPGFSTKTEVTDVSGRGVGMDVVRHNIQKMKGRIDIQSVPGSGSKFTISLPLTLAILPVMMLSLCGQAYALPLSAVREIISLSPESVQWVNGHPTRVIRDEVLPVFDLAALIGRTREQEARFGVIALSGDQEFILAVDGFIGQDEVMIKPLEGVKPKGVSGATLSGDGTLVLVLELHELLKGVFKSN